MLGIVLGLQLTATNIDIVIIILLLLAIRFMRIIRVVVITICKRLPFSTSYKMRYGNLPVLVGFMRK